MHPLKEFLTINNLTYQKFAEELRISAPSISYWISGKFRPTKRYAKRIEKITGIPIEFWGFYRNEQGKVKKLTESKRVDAQV